MLTTIENLCILLFVILLLSLGYYFSKNIKDMESYYLGNRNLPWSLIVGTLVATWYGGVGTVGSVEYAALYGISVWAIWSVPAHIGRMPLALWVGPKIHIRTGITVPDLLENLYGKPVAILGSILMFIYCAQLGEITAAGFIGEAAWGLNKVLVASIIVLLVVLLATMGGLMGVAVTDMVLFFCICFGLTMVVPLEFDKIGGFSGIQRSLSDPNLLHPTKGMSVMQALMLIVYSFGAYSDPTFYQRFSAAGSPKVGRRALLTCFTLWLCLDIVLTVTGLLVKVKYPDMQPAMGYIKLILENFPPVVRVLFMIGLLGSIVSTLDGYYLSAGATLANDIFARIYKKELSQKQLIALTRLGIIIVAILGLSIAFNFPTARDACLFLGSIWMASAFVPIVCGLVYNGDKTQLSGLLSMIVGGISFGYFKAFPIKIFTIEPLVAALPLSFIAWIIGQILGKNKKLKV